MFEVGRTGMTNEFSVYKMRSPYTAHEAYLIELDGEKVGLAETPDAARKLAQTQCKLNKLKYAGLTELFGRNRQYLQGPRGGWKTYRVD